MKNLSEQSPFQIIIDQSSRVSKLVKHCKSNIKRWIQTITYSTKEKSKVVTKELFNMKGPCISRGGTGLWNTECIDLPKNLPPTKLAGRSQIINVEYYFDVSLSFVPVYSNFVTEFCPIRQCQISLLFPGGSRDSTILKPICSNPCSDWNNSVWLIGWWYGHRWFYVTSWTLHSTWPRPFFVAFYFCWLVT